MRVLVDADGCPVVDIVLRLCRRAAVACILLCDTAHEFHRPGVQTLVFDKGADSVDFALANRVLPGDLVVTGDYGLASMCLAKQAQVLHPDGWCYHQGNIDALLLARHEARKLRASGGRSKGAKKRSPAQDAAFEEALNQLLQGKPSGGSR